MAICRRERLKPVSDYRPDLEVLKSEYLVFKKSPLPSPAALPGADSYFCLLSPAFLESGKLYLEVSHHVLKTLEPETAQKIVFAVHDFADYSPYYLPDFFNPGWILSLD